MLLALILTLSNPLQYKQGSAPYCTVDQQDNLYCFYYSKRDCLAAIQYNTGMECVRDIHAN